LAFFHSLQDVCKASVVAAEERKQQLIVDAQNYLEQIEEIAKELHIDTKVLPNINRAASAAIVASERNQPIQRIDTVPINRVVLQQ
jgi:uncharacterized protein (UPF0147 family)